MLRLIFALLLTATLWSEVPVLDRGRVRPLSALARESNEPVDSFILSHQELKLLPPKRAGGTWSTLKNPHLAAYSVDPSLPPEKILEALEGNYRTLSRSDLPTPLQLKAELLLTAAPWIKALFILYTLAALLLLLPRTLLFGKIALMAAFTLHTGALLLRIFVLERPPVANMGETLLYVPWIALLLSLFSKERTLRASAAFLAALLLFILYKTGMDGLDRVQPVLNSQLWLMVHVLMVVGSYGAFLLAGVLGHALILRPSLPLQKPLLHCLYIGTALLIVGTILGGVWAAQSWGRFWDWDPKESWAFISACTYLALIHAERFGKIGPFGLAMGSIAGLMVITFTWYGVNYILGVGLHSYGFGNGGEKLYAGYLLAEGLFLLYGKSQKNLAKRA